MLSWLGATDIKEILLGFCTLLFLAFLWFLKRIIDRQDKVNDQVEDKLGKHSKAMADLTANAQTANTEMVKKLTEATATVQNEAVQMKKANLDFQIKINDELHKVKQGVLEVENAAHKSTQGVQEMNQKLGATQERLGGLYDRVESHSRSLEMGAKEFGEVRQKVGKLENEWDNLKTTAIKLNEALTLITTRKKTDP